QYEAIIKKSNSAIGNSCSNGIISTHSALANVGKYSRGSASIPSKRLNAFCSDAIRAFSELLTFNFAISSSVRNFLGFAILYTPLNCKILQKSFETGIYRREDSAPLRRVIKVKELFGGYESIFHFFYFPNNTLFQHTGITLFTYMLNICLTVVLGSSLFLVITLGLINITVSLPSLLLLSCGTNPDLRCIVATTPADVSLRNASSVFGLDIPIQSAIFVLFRNSTLLLSFSNGLEQTKLDS